MPVADRELAKRTSICQSIRMEARARTAHFVLRLNQTERDILARVAQRLGMNASECMRYLIRRADEESSLRPGAPTGTASKRPRKRPSR